MELEETDNVSDLLRICPTLLQDNDSQVTCINYVIARMAICDEDETEELKLLLRMLCSYCPPCGVVVEGLLNIMSCIPHPELIIDAIPQLCSNSLPEVELIVEAYQDLQSSDRSLLVPVLGSLSCLQLPAHLRAKVYTMAEESMSTVDEEDLPAVLSTLLKTIDPDHPGIAVSHIRRQSYSLAPNILVLIMKVLRETLKTSLQTILLFLMAIKEAPKLYPFDMCVIMLLINHRRKQRLCRQVFIDAITSKRLSLNLLLSLCQPVWSDLLQPYAESILTMCELFLRPTIMLTNAFILANNTNMDRKRAGFTNLSPGLTEQCPLDWAMHFIPRVYCSFAACRISLLKFLTAICSNEGRNNNSHIVTGNNYNHNDNQNNHKKNMEQSRYYITPLSFQADVASLCIVYISSISLSTLTTSRSLFEESVYNSSNYHPIVAHRICIAMSRLCALEPAIQQTVLVPIQKHLAAPRLNAIISGLTIATNVLCFSNLSVIDWGTVSGWILRMLSTLPRPSSNTKGMTMIGTVFDHLTLIAKQVPDYSMKYIYNILLTQYFQPFICNEFKILNYTSLLNTLDRDIDVSSTTSSTTGTGRIVRNIPRAYIYGSIGNNNLVFSLFSSGITPFLEFSELLIVLSSFWNCYMQYLIINVSTSSSSSSSTSSTNKNIYLQQQQQQTMHISDLITCHWTPQDVLLCGFELPLSSKRLEQLLFPKNGHTSPNEYKHDINAYLTPRLSSLTDNELTHIISSCQMAYILSVSSLNSIMQNLSYISFEILSIRLAYTLKLHRLILLSICILNKRQLYLMKKISFNLPELHPDLLFRVFLSDEFNFEGYEGSTLTKAVWERIYSSKIEQLHHLLRLLSRHLYISSSEHVKCIGSFQVLELIKLDYINQEQNNMNMNIPPPAHLAPYRQLLSSLSNTTVLLELTKKINQLHNLITIFRRIFPQNCPCEWSTVSNTDFALAGSMGHIWSLMLDSLHFMLYLLQGTLVHGQIQSENIRNHRIDACGDDSTMDTYTNMIETMLPACNSNINQSSALDTEQVDTKKSNLNLIFKFYCDEAKKCDNFSLALDYVNLCSIITRKKIKAKSVGVLSYQLLLTLFPHKELPSYYEHQNKTSHHDYMRKIDHDLSLCFLSDQIKQEHLVSIYDLLPSSGLVASESTRQSSALSSAFKSLRSRLYRICSRKGLKNESFQVQVLFWTMMAYASFKKHYYKYFSSLLKRLKRFVNDNNDEIDNQMNSFTIDTCSLYFELLFTSILISISQLDINETIQIPDFLTLITELLDTYNVFCTSDRYSSSVHSVRVMHGCLNSMFPLLQFQISSILAVEADIEEFSVSQRLTILSNINIVCIKLVEKVKKMVPLLKAQSSQNNLVPRLISRLAGFEAFLHEQEDLYELDTTTADADVEEEETKVSQSESKSEKKSTSRKRKIVTKTTTNSDIKEDDTMKITSTSSSSSSSFSNKKSKKNNKIYSSKNESSSMMNDDDILSSDDDDDDDGESILDALASEKHHNKARTIKPYYYISDESDPDDNGFGQFMIEEVQ